MNNHIQNWCFNIIAEEYDRCHPDSFSEEDYKEEYFIDKNWTFKETFKDTLEEFLDNIDPEIKKPLIDAILNSIDWKKIYDNMLEYIED
jgi:F0F1-type ATP synthase delta subunit